MSSQTLWGSGLHLLATSWTTGAEQQFSRGYWKIVYSLRRNKTCFSHRKRAAWQCELFFYATFPWLSIWWQRLLGDDGLSGWWERDIQRAAQGSRPNLSFQNSNSFTWPSSCYRVFRLFSLFSVSYPPPRGNISFNLIVISVQYAP